MIRARLKVVVSDRSVSRSLVQAVGPDNVSMAGLQIFGRALRRSAEFRMAFDGRVETFILTLDDMLQCLQAAEKTLDRIARGNLG